MISPYALILFLTQFSIVYICATNTASAAHHITDILRPDKFCLSDPVRNHMRDSPCISRYHHYQILSCLNRPGIARFDPFHSYKSVFPAGCRQSSLLYTCCFLFLKNKQPCHFLLAPFYPNKKISHSNRFLNIRGSPAPVSLICFPSNSPYTESQKTPQISLRCSPEV